MTDENREVETVELMYRQPGVSAHQKLPEVLDEIILAIRDLSERVTVMEEWCHDVNRLAQTYDDNYGGTD